jgi:hypothetical protein
MRERSRPRPLQASGRGAGAPITAAKSTGGKHTATTLAAKSPDSSKAISESS